MKKTKKNAHVWNKKKCIDYARLAIPRKLVRILFIGIILFGWQNSYSQNLSDHFKKGDWFECEMEFDNSSLPVFRNHFASDVNMLNTNLLSVRFTNMVTNADSLVWQYEVLRYKKTFKPTWLKEQENLYCFDTWYPDFFTKNFDSVRNSYKGILSFEQNNQIKHFHSYNSEFQALRCMVPMQEQKNNLPVNYYTSRLNSGNELAGFVERMASIIFNISQIKEDSTTRLKWNWIENIHWVHSNEVQFTIHNNGSEQKSNCSAYLLDNGLPYAFSDFNGQLVQTITKASFAVRNTVVVKISDNRNASSLDPHIFKEVIKLIPDNSSFVLNESESKYNDEDSVGITQKKYSLKCGTIFSLFYATNSAKIYLEPGDTLELIIPKDLGKPLVIKNNPNSIWWQQNQAATIEAIEKAPISNEFKCYLKLQHEFEETISTLQDMNNNELRTSLLKFFHLKSYHYSSLSRESGYSILQLYNNKKQNLSYATGSNYLTGFNLQYYHSIINYQDFNLYFNLKNILVGQYAFSSMMNSKDKYDEFINRCGDTLITKQIKEKLQARNSILPGNHLPFNMMITEQKQEVYMLPERNKYALLLIYAVPSYIESFNKLRDSLPGNIQTVAYRSCANGRKELPEQITANTFKNNDHISLFGHPDDLDYYNNITGSALNVLFLLYNDKGEILYVDMFDKRKDYEIDLEFYKSEVQKAIVQYEQKGNDNKSGILLWLTLALGLGLLLIILVYWIVITRMKKKNEQDRMIQELKLKSVQSQLNPHFVFNALNSIQLLINSAQNKQANSYLIGFSNLLRGVLDNADKRIVPLADEMAMIEQYCELEKLRLQFKCSVQINTKTPLNLIEVPYMLLQPLVENSIKHGIAKKQGNGELNIDIFETNATIEIKIRDNGPGLNNQSMNELKQKGKGLTLTSEKIHGIYNGDALFTVGETQEGTEAYIKLKIG